MANQISPRFIGSIVSWSRRRRPIVAAATAVIVLVALGGLMRLEFDTDVLSLLPRDGRAIPAFRRFLATFGTLDQLYIVFTAPPGESIDDYDEEIGAWVEQLRRTPEIAAVDTGSGSGRDFGWLADRELLLMRESELSRALERFKADGMRQAIAARRELLAVPSEEITQLVRQDPLGLFDLLRDQVGGSQGGLNIGLGQGGYVTKDGRRRLVIAQPRRPPTDTVFAHALFARLDTIKATVAKIETSADVGGDSRPPLEIEFAGGHRIAIETEATVRRESIANTVGSLALILPLLFIVFRSFWLVVAGALPSTIALLVVLGALGYGGVTLSVATAASAAMLFGLGVDGVVLLYVAYNHAVSAGDEPGAAIDRLAWPSFSMLLGMWTTAATFYGLAFVDFPSLTQLGQLIGHSMVLCGIFTLVLVPATLPLRRRRRPERSLRMPGLSESVRRFRTPILVAGLIVTIALGAAASRLRINPTLDRLKSITPAAILQTQILPMFGLPGDPYVVIHEGPSLQPLLAANERLIARLAQAAPGVLVQGPSTLLPADETQARRAAIVKATGLAADRVMNDLGDAARDAGFRAGSFDPFRERLPKLLDPASRLTYEGYASHGLRDVLDRFVAKTDRGWVTATYVFPSTASQVARIEDLVPASDNDAVLTGVPIVNRELAVRFVPQFLRGVGIGTAIVIVIVVAAFRSWWLSLLALLPTVVGLIWAGGILGLAGAELDLFALFAVVTFVGIGVDYGIHLVQRYRETGDARHAIEELAPVILVAAAITVLGYGTLVTSSYPPLRSIGVVSAVSVAALSVASVVLLPTLLMRARSGSGGAADAD